MKKVFNISVWSFFLSLITFGGLILSTPKAVHANNYQVTGTVSNSSLVGIADTVVDVIDVTTQNTVVSAVTDVAGNYTLTLVEGTYHVRVTPPGGSGYGMATALNKAVSGNTVLNFVLVQASASVSFSGRLLDVLGNPVPGLQIQLGLESGPLLTATTNANGEYLFNLAPQNVFVSIPPINSINNSSLALASGFTLQGNGHYFAVDNDTILDIILPSKKVDVHVQDSFGSPIAGASVYAERNYFWNCELTIGPSQACGYSYYPSFSPVNTDANGNVTLWLFPNPTGSSYAITVLPPGGSNYSIVTEQAVSILTDTNLTITLTEQNVTLSGRLLDPLANPVPGVQIQLGLESGPILTAATNQNGEYFFSLSPQNVYLSIPLSHYLDFGLAVPYEYTLQGNGHYFAVSDDTVLDLTLPSKKIDVHVQDSNGNPVIGAAVYAEKFYGFNSELTIGPTPAAGSSRYPSFAPRITSANGDVDFWLFPTPSSGDGNYYNIVVIPPSGSPYQLTTLSNVHVTTDAALSVTMAEESVALSGRLLDSLTNPVPGVQVLLGLRSGVVLTSTTNANGEYSFSLSPQDAYLSIFINSNSNPALAVPRNYTLQGNGNYFPINSDTVIDIVLPSKKVDVHVQDNNGNPIAGAAVYADRNYLWNCGLTIGPTQACGYSYYYSGSPVITDSAGNVSLWLFPSPIGGSYSITIIPPGNSNYAIYTLNNLAVTTDLTEIISLQLLSNPPVISTTSLPQATVGAAYSRMIEATGDNGPLVWSRASGNLPDGFTLNPSTGQLSGTPTLAGTYTFAIQVANAFGQITSQSFSMIVNAPTSIIRNNLPDVRIGHNYNQTVTATGGALPLTWGVSAGSLPSGLSLNTATGVIAGKPTTLGNYGFTVRVLDANNVSATKSFNIQVKP